MFDISPIQILIVLAIALLIFGPKRLPDLGRNLGRGIKDFKGGLTGEDDAPPPAAARVAPAPEEAPTAQELVRDASRPEEAERQPAGSVPVP